jgi:hypothetical protein
MQKYKIFNLSADREKITRECESEQKRNCSAANQFLNSMYFFSITLKKLFQLIRQVFSQQISFFLTFSSSQMHFLPKKIFFILLLILFYFALKFVPSNSGLLLYRISRKKNEKREKFVLDIFKAVTFTKVIYLPKKSYNNNNNFSTASLWRV